MCISYNLVSMNARHRFSSSVQQTRVPTKKSIKAGIGHAFRLSSVKLIVVYDDVFSAIIDVLVVMMTITCLLDVALRDLIATVYIVRSTTTLIEIRIRRDEFIE